MYIRIIVKIIYSTIDIFRIICYNIIRCRFVHLVIVQERRVCVHNITGASTFYSRRSALIGDIIFIANQRRGNDL